MRKVALAGLGAATALVPIVAAGPVSASTAAPVTHVIEVRDDYTFKPGGSLKFATHLCDAAVTKTCVSTIKVRTGDKIKLTTRDVDGQLHTATFTPNKADLPTSIKQPCKLCDETLNAHFGGSDNKFHLVVDKGTWGINARGDSQMAIAAFHLGHGFGDLPAQSTIRTVTAPAGTVFYVMDAVHPWAQSQVIVTK
jgi:hypothetical protein